MNRATLQSGDQGGFTVIELTVALAVSLIALALILPTYLAVSTSSSNTQSITTADTAILPALDKLAADVSSAGSMATPSSNTVVLTTCRVHSDTSDCSTLSGNVRCSQWEVSSTGLLERRTWSPSGSSPSFVVFPGTSDLIITSSSRGTPLFAANGSTDTLSGQASALLTIDFMVQAGTTSPKREIQASFAAQSNASGTCTPSS